MYGCSLHKGGIDHMDLCWFNFVGINKLLETFESVPETKQY
jgi:hypothetical protein